MADSQPNMNNIQSDTEPALSVSDKKDNADRNKRLRIDESLESHQRSIQPDTQPSSSATDVYDDVNRQKVEDSPHSSKTSDNQCLCTCLCHSESSQMQERQTLHSEQDKKFETLLGVVIKLKNEWQDAYEKIQKRLEMQEKSEEYRSFEETAQSQIYSIQQSLVPRREELPYRNVINRNRIQAGHQRMPTMVTPGPSGAQLQRSYIWSGVIEWMEKGKAPGDQQKTTKHLPCQVSASTKDIEPELKVDTWPNKLLMQLMPKQLISNIGGQYLKDSKSVLFHLQPSEALDALTKVMVNGFAGCVHFSPMPTPPQCDIKVLILLYTPDKKAYLGFIPNNQATFVDRLRKVIQQQKISQIISKQQLPAAVSNAGGMQQNMPNATMAGTIPIPGGAGMSSGGMGAGMSGSMQAVPGTSVGSMPGPAGSQGMVQSQMQQHPQGMMIGGSIGQQVQQVGGKGPRPVNQLDGLEAARQHNLEKIQHLQQTLEAAHQQEAQFKSQMDIMSHLHAAQQQEQHYKQLEEQRKHQLQQQMQQLRGAGSVSHPPRVMRPMLPSNPGLRHLLQQQPQYRPGAGAPRPAAPPQQFDDVNNYSDFI